MPSLNRLPLELCAKINSYITLSEYIITGTEEKSPKMVNIQGEKNKSLKEEKVDERDSRV